MNQELLEELITLNSQFEGVRDMSDPDAVRYLLMVTQTYSKVADTAKKLANEIAIDIEEREGGINPAYGFKVRTRTTKKVDSQVFKEMHSEEYQQLCDEGAVTISAKAIANLDAEDSIIQSTSKFAELRAE